MLKKTGKNTLQRCIICPESLTQIWSEYIHDATNSKKHLIDTVNEDVPLKSYQQSVISHFEQEVLLANNRQRVDVSVKNKPATHMPSKPCGYLVWHDMGSGKTLIGLHYLRREATEATEDRKNICSQMLTNKNTTILTYEHIQTQLQLSRDKCPNFNFNFDESRIVFDEAHYLVKIFRDTQILHNVRQEFYHKIRSAQHFMLLTGTPFNHIHDLPLLVNLCTDKGLDTPLVPFSKRLFFREYFSTSYSKSFVYGYLRPILVKSRLALAPAITLGGVALTSIWGIFDKAVSANTIGMNVALADTLNVSTWIGFIVPGAAASMGVVTYGACFIFTTIAFTYLFLWILRRLKKSADSDDLHTLDSNKLATKIAPYVSFYTKPNLRYPAKRTYQILQRHESNMFSNI